MPKNYNSSTRVRIPMNSITNKTKRSCLLSDFSISSLVKLFALKHKVGSSFIPVFFHEAASFLLELFFVFQQVYGVFAWIHPEFQAIETGILHTPINCCIAGGKRANIETTMRTVGRQDN